MITEGQQFAHYVDFPSPFRAVERNGIYYSFRIAAAAPNVLYVESCEREGEACSINAFAIDAANGYAVREATRGEFLQTEPILALGSNLAMEKESKKPPALQIHPIQPNYPHGEFEGYEYLGKSYGRRGEWMHVMNFQHSEDGKLITLTSADKRRLPKQGFLGDPLNAGFFGQYTVEIYDGDPARRLASVDIDCDTNVALSISRASLVNTRWFTIGLDLVQQRMLLFDFKPSQPK